MKKFFSFVLASLALVSAAVAQITVTGTLTPTTNTVISTVPVSVISFTLTDTSGTNNLMILYDTTDATSTNIVRAAYTSSGGFLTNQVITFTNRAAVVQTYTNQVWHTYTTSVAAATNSANIIFQTTVPLNTSQTFDGSDFIAPLGTTRGLAIRAVGGAGLYTVTYVPKF